MSDDSLSKRLVARLGGALAAAAGLAVLVGLPLLSEPGPRRWVLAGTGTIAFVGSVVTWHLPWERWSTSASLWLAPIGFLLVAISDIAALPEMPFMYSIFYLAIFGWIGLGHRQFASLKMAVPATIAYLSPLVVAPAEVEQPLILSASWSFLLPICLTIGESLSWISGRLRKAEIRDLGRMAGMAELLEASSALARLDDAESLAPAVAAMAGTMLDGQSAATMLLESDGTLLATAAWQGHEAFAIPGAGPHRPSDIIDAIRVGDVRVLDGPDGTKTPLLVMPLRGTGEPIGAVGVLLREGAPPPDAFMDGLGRALATQAGLAFERAWSMQSLVDDSLRDELTGLGNRRHGAVLLSHLAPGSTVVMLDLDHFKQVNDALGHGAGDDVLRAASRYLRGALRDSDQIARWGGDEFLIVLHGAHEGVRTTMERIRAGWLATSPAATFSAGIATHTPGNTPSRTLSQADTAMYHAKRAGRDRIVEHVLMEAAIS